MGCQPGGNEQEDQAFQGADGALMAIAQTNKHLPNVQGKKGQGSMLNASPMLNVLQCTIRLSIFF